MVTKQRLRAAVPLRSKVDLEHMDPTDRATPLRITEPGTPSDALARNDLHMTSVSTVYVGTVDAKPGLGSPREAP